MQSPMTRGDLAYATGFLHALTELGRLRTGLGAVPRVARDPEKVDAISPNARLCGLVGHPCSNASSTRQRTLCLWSQG